MLSTSILIKRRQQREPRTFYEKILHAQHNSYCIWIRIAYEEGGQLSPLCSVTSHGRRSIWNGVEWNDLDALIRRTQGIAHPRRRCLQSKRGYASRHFLSKMIPASKCVFLRENGWSKSTIDGVKESKFILSECLVAGDANLMEELPRKKYHRIPSISQDLQKREIIVLDCRPKFCSKLKTCHATINKHHKYKNSALVQRMR